MAWENLKTYGQMDSGSGKIVVKLVDLDGRRILDVRWHYVEKGTGDLKPSKGAIMVGLEDAEEFGNLVATAVMQLAQDAKEDQPEGIDDTPF